MRLLAGIMFVSVGCTNLYWVLDSVHRWQDAFSLFVFGFNVSIGLYYIIVAARLNLDA